MDPVTLTLGGRTLNLLVTMGALRRARVEGIDTALYVDPDPVKLAAMETADPLAFMLLMCDAAYVAALHLQPGLSREEFEGLLEPHNMSAIGQAVGTLIARINTPDLPKAEAPEGATANP